MQEDTIAARPDMPSHSTRSALDGGWLPTTAHLPKLPGYVWYVVGLLTIVNIFNYMDRMAVSVLLPQIKSEFQLSDTQLGILTGFGFFLFYAVCGIPLARWADKGVRKTVIASTLVAWSVMTAFCGAAQNFTQLFVARAGLAAAEAGGVPAATSLLADYVPEQRRPLILAIYGIGLNLGLVVGMVLAGWLGSYIGWRWTFAVLGVPGLGLAFIIKWTLREPLRGAFDAAAPATGKAASLSVLLPLLLRNRVYRSLVCAAVVGGFAQYGLSQWWPTYYSRVLGAAVADVVGLLGLCIAAGSAIGLLAGGFIAQRLMGRSARLPLVAGIFAVLLAAPCAIASVLVHSTTLSIALFGAATLLVNLPSAAIAASILASVPSDWRATAVSVQVFLMAVLGFGLGPVLVGVLSDSLSSAHGGEALRLAMLAPASAFALMVLPLYLAVRAMRDKPCQGAASL